MLDRYKKLIYSVPVRYRLSPEDTNDVFQAVCLELYRSLPRLREQRALRGWLAKVAAHESYRWKCRAQRFGQDDGDGDLTDPAQSQTEILERVEREHLFREALDGLSARCRQMVSMLFFQDPPVPYADVARNLGLAAGSIGFIRGRCLAKMRQGLEHLGFR